MSQQGAVASKTDNSVLSCVRQRVTSESREVIVPLYSALARPCLECWVQLGVPQYRRHMDILE